MKSKRPATKPKSKASATELEFGPDAWPKFEALVRSAAKMGHKPHSPATTGTRKKNVTRT